jgi:two-component system sensor histidine kinase DegS
MASKPKQSESNFLEKLDINIQNEIAKIKQELNETIAKFSQSESELKQLIQKNTSITGELQRLQPKIGEISIVELKSIYEVALDIQQKYYVSRVQHEKLQNDQNRLEAMIEVLESYNSMIKTSLENSKLNLLAPTNLEVMKMIIQSQEVERQEISRQLHDGPAQALSNFILQTEIVLRLLEIDQGKAQEEILNLKESAEQSFKDIRDYIFYLKPMQLKDQGLRATIQRYVDVFINQAGITVSYKSSGNEKRLPQYIELMILRAIQELLNNAIENNRASQVEVLLDYSNDQLQISIKDNGRGADTTFQRDVSAQAIDIIRDRVNILGGDLSLENMTEGGTRIQLIIPMGLVDFS